MAQAPADPDLHADLEARVLRTLREAGTPLKALQLSRQCQVPKKTLNQTLYRMKKESKVVLTGLATWNLAEGGSGPEGRTEQAASCQGSGSPPCTMVAVPERQPPGVPSEMEENICRLLAAGPQKALLIAQALGFSRAKDVNPTLHRMQARRLLHKDANSGAWELSPPAEDPGGRSRPSALVIQKNPVTIHVQNVRSIQVGDSGCIVTDSRCVQFGDGCCVVTGTASGLDATRPTDEPPCSQDRAQHCGQDSVQVSGPDSGQLSARLAAVRLTSQDGGPQGTAPDIMENGEPQGTDPNVPEDKSPPGTDSDVAEDGGPQGMAPDVSEDGSPRRPGEGVGANNSQPGGPCCTLVPVNTPIGQRQGE